MTENIELSIIIPVYNTKNYLPQCLDSILSQTNNNIEIICVNDGTTDSSLEILKKYQNQNENIQIINQKNKGAGAARNKGLACAKGKYVLFIDSDDWINQNLINTILDYTQTTNCDIFCFNGALFDNKKQKFNGETFFHPNNINPVLQKYSLCSHKDFSHIFYNNLSSVNKAYKREFLLKNNIRFPENIHFEDWIFHHETLFKTEKIAVIKEPLYYYRIGQPNSFVTKMKKNRSIFDLFQVLKQYKTILKDTNLYSYYQETYENYMVWILKIKFIFDVQFMLKKEFLNQTKSFLNEEITQINQNNLLDEENKEFLYTINNFNWLSCWFKYYTLYKIQKIIKKLY